MSCREKVAYQQQHVLSRVSMLKLRSDKFQKVKRFKTSIGEKFNLDALMSLSSRIGQNIVGKGENTFKRPSVKTRDSLVKG